MQTPFPAVLYPSQSLRPADELAAILTTLDLLSARETELRTHIVAHREDCVGRDYHATVTRFGDRDEVEVERLPSLQAVYDMLLEGLVLVVDTETTGLHALSGDRLISVALLPVTLTAAPHTLAVEARAALHYIVNPGRPSSPEALAVHGLTEGDLESQAPYWVVAEDIARATVGKIVVAHNAPFDVGFLDMEASRLGRPFQSELKGIVDTRLISKLLWPGEAGSLDALAHRLGVDRGGRDDRHDAMEDADLLARCLPGLLDALHARIAADAMSPRTADAVRRGACTALRDSGMAEPDPIPPAAIQQLIDAIEEEHRHG